MSIGLKIIIVGLGGFSGAISRVFISKWLNKYAEFIPLGTLIVNLLGALFLGMIIGANSNMVVGLLIGTGFLGAFTTFSTLNLEIINLHIKGHKYSVTIYILFTYIAGLISAFVGYELGEWLYMK